MTQTLIKRKITVIGDGGSGKTCMLVKLAKNTFDPKYNPTVFENTSFDVEVKNRQVQLELWDTAGQEDYNRIMPLSYPGTDVLIICFALDSRLTFENVVGKWLPEIRFYCAEAPYVLVGCKSDLKDESVLAAEEIKKVCKEIGAIGYFECSAKEGKGVKEVFNFIGTYIYKDYRRKNRFKFFKQLWRNIKTFCSCGS